jgi:hypothetical protein
MWDDDLEIDSGHLSFARLLASFSPSEEVSRFLPAGEGRAGKAVSTWDEHAPAGEHATSGHAAAEMHAITGHAPAEMHAATGHAAAEMHATSGHTAAGVLRQGWRRNGNCRSKHGRGEAAEEFAFHDADPP